MSNVIPLNSPLQAKRLMRLNEVLYLLSVSRSTFYAGIKSGRYPAPIPKGPGVRASHWRSQDIMNCLANSDSTSSKQKSVIARLAKKSRVFQENSTELLKIGEAVEVIILVYLQKLSTSKRIQASFNSYDSSCLKRIEKRLAEIEKGSRPSLDPLLFWRPDLEDLELNWMNT